LVGAALVASAAHVPGVGEHLHEAPYMGVLFAMFAAACVAVAVVAAARPNPAVFVSAGGLCAAALSTYAATRLVAFPQLAGDVGNWGEPLGLVSVAAELLVLACALLLTHSASPTAGALPDPVSVSGPISR
jgi:hypothetical protein